MKYKKEIDTLVGCVLTASSIDAISAIERLLEDLSYDSFIRYVLLPVLEKAGHECMKKKEPTLAQAYVLGKVAKKGIALALKKAEKNAPVSSQKKGPIIMANIEDDFHSLGRDISVAILRAKGWKVIDMGNDVMAEEIVDEALKVGAGIIGLSAMMYSTALNIKKVRVELDRRGLSGKIKLAVGGAVFGLRKELIDIVGADGSCGTALDVPDLMNKLDRELKK